MYDVGFGVCVCAATRTTCFFVLLFFAEQGVLPFHRGSGSSRSQYASLLFLCCREQIAVDALDEPTEHKTLILETQRPSRVQPLRGRTTQYCSSDDDDVCRNLSGSPSPQRQEETSSWNFAGSPAVRCVVASLALARQYHCYIPSSRTRRIRHARRRMPFVCAFFGLTRDSACLRGPCLLL
jgi:hypothetical protein